MSRMAHRVISKHTDTIIKLFEMTADLQITLQEGEPIGTVLSRQSSAVIEAARRELERCRTPMSSMLKTLVEEPDNYDHAGIIMTLTALNLKLKTQQPITLEELTDLDERISDLEGCTEPLAHYTHYRGKGYVRD